MQLEVGSIVEGKVSGITNFGAFVDLDGGKKGMIHISEVASAYVNDIKDFLKEGQMVKAMVISVSDEGKISLSIKKIEVAEKPRERSAPRRQPAQPRAAVTSPGSFQWSPRKTENASFEDMMLRYKQTSDEKISDMKRGTETRRGTRRK